MKVTYAGETYDCTKAARKNDSATLWLTDGSTVKFSGISEAAWQQFQLENGSWEIAAPTHSDTERLDALEAAMLVLMGGMSNV